MLLRVSPDPLRGSTYGGRFSDEPFRLRDIQFDHPQILVEACPPREEIGDFGELVYGGMDWVDPALAKRSMQLLAEEVMPRVNAALGKKSAAA